MSLVAERSDGVEILYGTASAERPAARSNPSGPQKCHPRASLGESWPNWFSGGLGEVFGGIPISPRNDGRSPRTALKQAKNAAPAANDAPQRGQDI